ncbi:MAG: amidase [Cellvibrionaceae bacterium]
MHQKSESLAQQVASLESSATTPIALAERSLQRASQCVELNAFASLSEPVVMAQAKEATLRRQAGRPLSPIDGVPIAVKDNYLTKDYPTTACSEALPLEPRGVDATVVANLRAAGAIILGKTNMHEWAYGATNNTSNIGPTRNPHNLDHITGGSSGGSGAAVAAGIVSAALGSDTGGSVRIPSSACGIYGFKPSYGRASRHGVLPLSWSLDAPGPMTTNLEDMAYLLPYFFGADEKDASTFGARPFQACSNAQAPKLIKLTGAGLERANEVDKAVNAALLTSGMLCSEWDLNDVDSYFSAWETILHCEASAYHKHLFQKNPSGFSSVTRAHLEAGTRLTGVELLEAQKLRSRLLDVLLNVLPEWDALVLPTLPVVAPKQGDDWQEFGGKKVSTQDSMTWFCWMGNLAGLPCITLPVGQSDSGLPIGLMLMGRPNQDEKLLDIATKFERFMLHPALNKK